MKVRNKKPKLRKGQINDTYFIFIELIHSINGLREHWPPKDIFMRTNKNKHF